MSEGYINLFTNDHEGTNRPHFKGYLKIDNVDHEFALWPAREGKQGYTGKYKPKQAKEVESNVTQADADKVWAEVEKKLQPKQEVVQTDSLLDSEIPF